MMVSDWNPRPRLAPRRGRLGAALMILTLGAMVAPAVAQPPRGGDTRDRVVDDLLRELIDTELRSRESERALPGYNEYDNQGLTRPRVPMDTPTREMQAARRILVEVSQEADRLSTLLNADVRRVPEIRPLMADVLKLRARAAVVSQRAMQQNDHMLIVADLQDLDRNWRVLAHRLGQIRGLDPRVMDSVDRLNDYAKSVADALKIQPQLDRSALIRLTAALAADLRNLMEDIDAEMGRSPERNQYLVEGRRVEQQAQQLTYVIAERVSYQTVIDEYKRFQGMWRPFATSLRSLNSRYLERSIRRIVETDNQLRDLLWLPTERDPEQYLYLTQLLRKDVDEFFSRAPLKLLIELPNAQAVIPTANEFHGVCDNFIDCVERGESYDDLVDAFHYIEGAWRSFDVVFRPLQSSGAQQVLSQIDRDINALRESMNIQTGYDDRAVVEMAASIDNLANHLDADMKLWLNRSRVPYRNDALRQSAQFAQAAHHLHEGLVSGAPTQEIQREVDLLFADWRRLQVHVEKCDTPERGHLQILASQLTQSLVELRTMVAPY